MRHPTETTYLNRQVRGNINLYSFRHTFRSRCGECGIPTEISETILGHETGFKFTYIHLSDEALLEWIKRLEYPEILL